MKILGITGGIGSGKSVVTGLFAELGAEIIDADAISRQVLKKDGSAYPETVRYFGEEILFPNGEIDRKRLAQMVFSDHTKLQRLNDITHTAIFREMQEQLNRATADLVCMDVPLLFSSNFPFSCDKTLAVVAPEALRVARVMERDGCTPEQVKERMAHQLSDEELRSRADYCIENTGTVDSLKGLVEEIYQDVMGLEL
ncbi:MAG: dephospho-CoA kinase [Clostridia bacterium]|nr:dephospho-CoA kinase [Clostridia bacterium]